MREAVPPTPLQQDTPHLSWSDALLLGYGPMDDVHQEFVQVVQHLMTCSDEALAGAMEAFIAHAEAHFGEEDRWMRETAFPARDCHSEEHAAVMKSAHEVLERVRDGQPSIAREFAAELARWFPGHADYLDSALAHWMFKREHQGKPIVIRRNVGKASTV